MPVVPKEWTPRLTKRLKRALPPADPVKGDTGPAGVAGAAGPAGVAGPTGPAGSAGTNGTNGAAGAAGSAGAAGTNGAAGAAGNDGATGPAGTTVYTRSSDLTITANASTSLGLSFSYAAGETWTARFTIHITTTGLLGVNFKLNTLPTGVVGRMNVDGPTTSLIAFSQQSTATLTTTTTLNNLALAATGTIEIDLLIRGGSGSGTIDLMLVTPILQGGTVYRESNVVVAKV